VHTKAESALLLREALPYLRQAFGLVNLVVLLVQQAPGGWSKAVLYLPEDFTGDAEQALRRFDDLWGRHNWSRAHGELVFDYASQ